MLSLLVVVVICFTTSRPPKKQKQEFVSCFLEQVLVFKKQKHHLDYLPKGRTKIDFSLNMK